MRRLRITVECIRPGSSVTEDAFGNLVGEDRAELVFHAAYIPPSTMAGSQIIDGRLSQTTIIKPSLLIDYTKQNLKAFEAGALRSGDNVQVDGVDGWQIDGDPADWQNLQSGKHHLMVVELRKRVG